MDTIEAQAILTKVHCRCDGYGVLPGPKGLAIPCPNCKGEAVTNEQIKEARRVINASMDDDSC